jgi:predicted alpha/beta superfamily hydrolase
MNKTTFHISDGTATLERFEQFSSQHVAARHVDVWLPPGYAENPAERYPVLYMHDGQNLFDPAASYAGVDWGVDETITRLAEEGLIRAPVVVGIWNTPKRWHEYMPQKAFDLETGFNFQHILAKLQRRKPQSDQYLRFLVAELKPCIDQEFRTLTGQADTFIMGSSMGGLISLYAAMEYPQVFGGAGCLSTHWPASAKALARYVQSALPPPGSVRFYFDYGTETLDADYEAHQRRIDAVMAAVGYEHGRDWLSQKFEGDEHHERSWRARLHVPLKFLFGNGSIGDE